MICDLFVLEVLALYRFGFGGLLLAVGFVVCRFWCSSCGVVVTDFLC